MGSFVVGATTSETLSFNLYETTIKEVHSALRSGKTTCHSIVSEYLNRIQAYDQSLKINSVQTINPKALEQAKDLDAQQARGEWGGLLHCVPVLLKDTFETKDMPTSFGSALFQDWVSDRDATVVQRLQAAGAIILAKTTMGEFGNRYSGSAFGVIRNPYDLERNPSGSSAGTAVGITANFGLVGIGEDSTGSIRGPAAVTNLVGLRPTHGSVSLEGMMPATPSVDTLGPITRTAEDAELVLQVIADSPELSLASSPIEKQLNIGLITAPMSASTDPTSPDYVKVQSVINQALSMLKGRHVTVLEGINPLHLSIVQQLEAMDFDTYEMEEAIDNHLQNMTMPPVSSLQEIIDSGIVVPATAATINKALSKRNSDWALPLIQNKRQRLRQSILSILEEKNLSALVYATYHHQPTKIPEDVLHNPQCNDFFGWGDNRNLSPVTGLPALTMPAGLTIDGLPVGLEFIGAPYSESVLLELGRRVETAVNARTPPSLTPPLPIYEQSFHPGS